jgi:hypothetical protein
MTGIPETEARLDAVIDSLIRDHGRSALVVGGELTATARLLYETLPRFHPSFSFEDHLARRLAAVRVAAPPTTALPPPTDIGSRQPVRDAFPASAAADRRRRSLMAGGAIASGVSLAIPIAGAALVMWRRSRSSGGLL